MVDDAGHVVDQLDDELGHRVARRRLGGEDPRARDHVHPGVVLELGVAVDDVENAENLPLVLVEPLHLHVEERVGIPSDLLLALDRSTGAPCSPA